MHHSPLPLPPMVIYVPEERPSIFETPIAVIRGKEELSIDSPLNLMSTIGKIISAALTLIFVAIATISVIGLPITYFFVAEWKRQVENEKALAEFDQADREFTRNFEAAEAKIQKAGAEIKKQGEAIRTQVERGFQPFVDQRFSLLIS